jgi:hypothetical protein
MKNKDSLQVRRDINTERIALLIEISKSRDQVAQRSLGTAFLLLNIKFQNDFLPPV